MAAITGTRIKHMRLLHGMTQKQLGTAAGFGEQAADVRMAQYEAGMRSPKRELLQRLAQVLDVSPAALDVPNISNVSGVIHTLFALEDMYGFAVSENEVNPCIVISKAGREANPDIYAALAEWSDKAHQLREGKITKAEYDEWRYNR